MALQQRQHNVKRPLMKMKPLQMLRHGVGKKDKPNGPGITQKTDGLKKICPTLVSAGTTRDADGR